MKKRLCKYLNYDIETRFVTISYDSVKSVFVPKKDVSCGLVPKEVLMLEIYLPYIVCIKKQSAFKVDKWIIENLNGLWYNPSFTMIYHFELEEDAIAFKLRWL